MTSDGGPDYELAWPRDLLVSELQEILHRGWGQDSDKVEPLSS